MPFTPDSQYPIDISRLPTSWTVVRLGDVVREIRSGFSCGDYNELGKGIPHLRPMNIDRRGRLLLDDLKFVSIEDAEGKPRAGAGDVLFNNTNSAELVGKTAAVSEGEWAFSNHMTLLRPSTGVSHRFLAFQLHYLWERGYFRLRRTQHINQAVGSGNSDLLFPEILTKSAC